MSQTLEEYLNQNTCSDIPIATHQYQNTQLEIPQFLKEGLIQNIKNSTLTSTGLNCAGNFTTISGRPLSAIIPEGKGTIPVASDADVTSLATLPNRSGINTLAGCEKGPWTTVPSNLTAISSNGLTSGKVLTPSICIGGGTLQQEAVRIGCDGTVTLGPGMTTDSASRLFWNKVSDMGLQINNELESTKNELNTTRQNYLIVCKLVTQLRDILKVPDGESVVDYATNRMGAPKPVPIIEPEDHLAAYERAMKVIK